MRFPFARTGRGIGSRSFEGFQPALIVIDAFHSRARRKSNVNPLRSTHTHTHTHTHAHARLVNALFQVIVRNFGAGRRYPLD